MSTLRGKKLVHVTTVDMSLVLLLGPQLRAFADAGMEVVGVSAPGPFVRQLESWGIRHEPLRHATRSTAVGQDIMALVELWQLFRRLRPDIVHTHNPKPGLYGRVAARAAGVHGVVNTVHGLYASPEDRASRKAVVYSPRTRGLDVLRRRAGPEPRGSSRCWPAWACRADKLVLLGNGVELQRFRPESRRAPSPTSPGGPRRRRRRGRGWRRLRVSCGRRVSVSSLRRLNASARRTPRSSSSSSEDPIPTRPTRSRPRSSPPPVAEGASSSPVSRDEMEHVYPAFDLFVLPSHREGFPRSAMEAAASGLPVIATDIRGCRQVVSHGQSGLLVPLHDPVRLAAAIEELVVDPALRQRMGIAGRRKAEAEFDDRAVVSKTMDAYERVLDPRHILDEASDALVGHAAVVAVEVERLRRLGQADAQRGVAQQPHRGRGEVLRIVGQQQMHAVLDVQSFRSERGRHHRDAMCEGLEDLHPGPAAVSDRDHGHRRPSKLLLHGRDLAHHGQRLRAGAAA